MVETEGPPRPYHSRSRASVSSSVNRSCCKDSGVVWAGAGSRPDPGEVPDSRQFVIIVIFVTLPIPKAGLAPAL